MDRLTKRVYGAESAGIKYLPVKSEDYFEILNKLGEYEELEDQGLLLKLPCKVGDECYVPNATFKRVFEVYCISISKDKENIWVRCGNGLMYIWNEEIFATKEEAEAKLKELENENI